MNVEIPDIDVKSIPKDILDKMEFDSWKWICKAEGCNRYSHLKDYGAYPLMYYHKKWVNIYQSYLLCGTHWKLRHTNLKLKSQVTVIDEVDKIIS